MDRSRSTLEAPALADGTIEITIKGDVATTVRNPSSSSGQGFEQLTSTFSRKARTATPVEIQRLNDGKKLQESTKLLKLRNLLMLNRTGLAIKLPVFDKGIYYVDASDISAMLNMPLQRVKRHIKNGLFSVSSREVQTSCMPAKDNAGIFFYGTAVDNVYSNENVYWLTANRGVQMASIDGGKPHFSGAVKDSFTDTLHMEQDLIAAPAITTDPNSDYWFWDYVVADTPSYDSKDFSFKAYSVSSSPHTAGITVRLYGISSTGVSPEHHAVISLNGVTVAEGRWTGINPYSVVANIDQSLIKEGDNVLEVKAVLDANVPYSLFMIDSFDVTYARRYEAVNDTLRFTADGSPTISVGGFTVPDISVFDISDPLNPKVVTSTSIAGQNGNYSVKIYPASKDAAYIAVATTAVKKADGMADLPSDLKNKNTSADYIVITPEELKDGANLLADYRRSGGLSVKVVSLEDIMDEFNFGMFDPDAIKTFLQYAYNNWEKKPSYAVLVGAGTYDYKNAMGLGGNLIPPLMVGSPWGLVPSDNVLGDFTGDNVPEIAIGRIPVVTNTELQAVLDKIKSFEATRIDGIMMLSDTPDGGGNFPEDSNDISQILAAHPVQKIYLSDYQLDQARTLLFNGLTGGVEFVNYMGHAGIDQLSQDGLLTEDDVAGLSNSQYPVLTALTCMVGQFSFPGFESLTDALVVKDGGGIVSSWAPSGFSYNADAKILGEGFYTAAFQPGVLTLGDAVVRSMAGYMAKGKPSFILNSFNIIGDPALRIK
jgi:Peptidase family C25